MKIEIIAEIAQGYEGNPKLAELLVKGALAADADAVKIQLVFADELCIPSYPYYNLFKSLEMEEKTWHELVCMVHSAEKKIYFDVYGEHSLLLAYNLGADGIKISTTDFYNLPLREQVAKKFQKILVSVGGIPIRDIEEIVQYFTKHQLILMHGFQAEPTEVIDNNLARIMTLKNHFPQVEVGFMDHTLGSTREAFYLPLLAIGKGAICIEKHITLDYNLQIEDHISALSIDRFKEFVKILRAVEPALGNSELRLTTKEIEYKKRAGKVVVAKQDLAQGIQLTTNDLIMKRVSTTTSDKYYNQLTDVIGKKLVKNIHKDHPLEEGLLQ